MLKWFILFLIVIAAFSWFLQYQVNRHLDIEPAAAISRVEPGSSSAVVQTDARRKAVKQNNIAPASAARPAQPEVVRPEDQPVHNEILLQ